MPDKVKLNKHYIWDILEVDWKEVNVMFNGEAINLAKINNHSFKINLKLGI